MHMKSHHKLFYAVSVAALAIILTGCMAFSLESGPADSNPPVDDRLKGAILLYPGSMYAMADNEVVVIDPSNELITPFVQNNRTLVPVRFIAEAFGAEVSWDQSTQTATISADGRIIKIAIYSTEMTVDGTIVQLDVPAMTSGDRTFIPVRALAEALGKEVFYDSGLIVISNTAAIFDPVAEADLIKEIIEEINILPTVGSRENLIQMLNNVGAIRSGNIEYALASDKGAAQAVTNGPEATEESAAEYSGTNTQVAGVDEADIVKTDGAYLYQVSNQEVFIFKAYPADEMALVSKLSFSDEQFAPAELYVRENTLVIIGSSYDYPVSSNADQTYEASKMYPTYSETTVEVFIFNISDRQNPYCIRTVSLPGYYLSSRLIDDALYLISNQYINYWADDDMPLNPEYKDTAAGPEAIRVEYDDIKYMPPLVTSSYLVVAGLSLDSPTEPMSIETYLGAGEEIYVSDRNLYITINEGYGGIRPMMVTDAGFLPSIEREATLIYKFALKDATVTYTARGQVPGRILNQFSMDESANTFRIATTEGYSWVNGADGLSNNVYVLDENLNMLGKLENLAKGETIYSVRSWKTERIL